MVTTGLIGLALFLVQAPPAPSFAPPSGPAPNPATTQAAVPVPAAGSAAGTAPAQPTAPPGAGVRGNQPPTMCDALPWQRLRGLAIGEVLSIRLPEGSRFVRVGDPPLTQAELAGRLVVEVGRNTRVRRVYCAPR